LVAAALEKTEKVALRLIARAEQCTFGLTLKLERRGCDSASISDVISKLTEMGLLDDSRFARLWLTSKLHSARSPRRLLASLCNRGIDQKTAESALKNILNEETELVMLERFINKAKKSLNSESNGRTLKYLLRNEGFSGAIIERFLDFHKF